MTEPLPRRELPDAAGARLAEQAGWLGLLLAHLAGRRLRARCELEDLVQEVFLRALAPLSALPREEEGAAALRRFLAATARRTVIDAVRRVRAAKRDRPEVAAEFPSGSTACSRAAEPLAASAGPATAAALREIRSEWLEQFQRLPAEHRRVIGLRQLEGLSAAATGARMGRSAAAVHSLYRRALEAWGAGVENRNERDESAPGPRPQWT